MNTRLFQPIADTVDQMICDQCYKKVAGYPIGYLMENRPEPKYGF